MPNARASSLSLVIDSALSPAAPSTPPSTSNSGRDTTVLLFALHQLTRNPRLRCHGCCRLDLTTSRAIIVGLAQANVLASRSHSATMPTSLGHIAPHGCSMDLAAAVLSAPLLDMTRWQFLCVVWGLIGAAVAAAVCLPPANFVKYAAPATSRVELTRPRRSSGLLSWAAASLATTALVPKAAECHILHDPPTTCFFHL
ncbi:hypothetical protein FRC12_008468 [Ceratobasidium sp. 428]|nr:hypothetical protein FRC12_008468 [Ceratobasidium sp. 428]